MPLANGNGGHGQLIVVVSGRGGLGALVQAVERLRVRVVDVVHGGRRGRVAAGRRLMVMVGRRERRREVRRLEVLVVTHVVRTGVGGCRVPVVVMVVMVVRAVR